MAARKTKPKPEIVQKVAPISEMDRDTFCLHMTKRHLESLGGLSEISPASVDEQLEAAYRSFHKRLHATRVDLSHEHEAGDPAQYWQE